MPFRREVSLNFTFGINLCEKEDIYIIYRHLLKFIRIML